MTEKKKRNSGGSIKTIKGKLYARIQYLDETTGKRKEKLRPARNRTHARELINQMRAELKQGGQTTLESDKMPFVKIADEYENIKLIPPVFQNGIKVSGKRSYRHQTYLIKPLKAFFGRKAIRSIKPSDLEAYKAYRLQTPVEIENVVKRENLKKERKKFIREKVKVSRPRSITSVNRELALLRQIFVFAEAEDYISRNPFQRAKKLISLAAETVRERVLSFSEEKLLLSVCESESRKHIRPIIICALDTAARKGELLKLQWKDIDLINRNITFRATNTKTEKTRIVGMTERVKAELQKLLENSPKDENLLVFGIKDNFNRSWRSACKEAQINDDLHFHDLRHTGITRMIRAGISASEVMKVSGHTEMKTFQRYVNLTNDSVTQAANLLDNFNVGQNPILQLLNTSEMAN